MTEKNIETDSNIESAGESVASLNVPERRRLREFVTKTFIVLSGVAGMGTLLVNYAVDEIDSSLGDRQSKILRELEAARIAAIDLQEDFNDGKKVFVDGACASIEGMRRAEDAGRNVLDTIESVARQPELNEVVASTTTTTNPALNENALRYNQFVEACENG